jgi:hypothetical protein
VSVRFSSAKPLQVTNWVAGQTTVRGTDSQIVHGGFEAGATVHGEADAEGELADWEVGFLQTLRVTWERAYWRRGNADGLGNFLENKLKIPATPLRDHAKDSPHFTDPRDVASFPQNSRSADLAVATRDAPHTYVQNSGKEVGGAPADGSDNLVHARTGDNFVSFVSARNKTTGEWRHLELVYWSVQTAVDFQPKPGGGIETTRDDRKLGQSPRLLWTPAADQPVAGGVRANDYVAGSGNYTVGRVDRWS